MRLLHKLLRRRNAGPLRVRPRQRNALLLLARHRAPQKAHPHQRRPTLLRGRRLAKSNLHRQPGSVLRHNVPLHGFPTDVLLHVHRLCSLAPDLRSGDAAAGEVLSWT